MPSDMLVVWPKEFVSSTVTSSGRITPRANSFLFSVEDISPWSSSYNAAVILV